MYFFKSISLIVLSIGLIMLIKNMTKDNTNDEKSIIPEPFKKEWFEDSVFTLNLTMNDSFRVKFRTGFILNSSSGGTESKPIPYQSRNAKDNEWETFGIGGFVLTEPDSHVWFKGYDSTRVKISYWYEKIK